MKALALINTKNLSLDSIQHRHVSLTGQHERHFEHTTHVDHPQAYSCDKTYSKG